MHQHIRAVAKHFVQWTVNQNRRTVLWNTVLIHIVSKNKRLCSNKDEIHTYNNALGLGGKIVLFTVDNYIFINTDAAVFHASNFIRHMIILFRITWMEVFLHNLQSKIFKTNLLKVMQYVCCYKLLNTFSDMQYLYIVKMSHNALSKKKKFQMTATDLNRAWFSLINAVK